MPNSKSKKGPKRAFPMPPNADAHWREWMRYRAVYTLCTAMNDNLISSSELAAMIDAPKDKIDPLFFNPSSRNARNPQLFDIIRLHDQFESDSSMIPTGLHGRRFNYVEMFEPDFARFTKYEIELMDKIKALETEIERLKG